ncbi:MAG: DEDD exonuclease domain-containing protein [Beutenbergiaceae bacterium]
MGIDLLARPPGGRLALPHRASSLAPGTPVQAALDEVGVPLREATFVVVDLETTGGSPKNDQITEIGAVKVRGGQVEAEFATLINPGVAIAPTITVLTGITNAMVLQAPRIESVLPAFLEFARGAILVAHNAGFDVGFLKANARRQELAWAAPLVVDTVKLARKVVTRDEAPNHKLSSLARLFGAQTTPNHRALADARATVDVLHGLLGRMASLGVTHVEDLATAADPVPPARRRRATIADDLPPCPGVYLFIGPNEQVLYVGTATNLRRRVRQYFTASEKRRRIGEMVDLAVSVRSVRCSSTLEARVRELRLIAAHDPPYNRRSKRPDRLPWIRLTHEPYPRLSVVRSVPPEAIAMGPFASHAAAKSAIEAIQHAFGVRSCARRLPQVPASGASACILGQIGHCLAPCINPQVGERYAAVAAQAADALRGVGGEVVSAAAASIVELVAAERFEQAGDHRDRALSYAHLRSRSLQLRTLQQAREVVAARAIADGGWEILAVRYGRLAGTATTSHGEDPMPVVAALQRSAESVPAPPRTGGSASSEETELLAHWLGQVGTRLIVFDHASEPGWSVPIDAAPVDLRRQASARSSNDRADNACMMVPTHSPQEDS